MTWTKIGDCLYCNSNGGSFRIKEHIALGRRGATLDLLSLSNGWQQLAVEWDGQSVGDVLEDKPSVATMKTLCLFLTGEKA